uniref:Uncharacterized protein n=1 Tax=Cacopsylla melanoneura TaxID=428564 RepID=A0A8D8YN78_9HEMI
MLIVWDQRVLYLSQKTNVHRTTTSYHLSPQISSQIQRELLAIIQSIVTVLVIRAQWACQKKTWNQFVHQKTILVNQVLLYILEPKEDDHLMLTASGLKTMKVRLRRKLDLR